MPKKRLQVNYGNMVFEGTVADSVTKEHVENAIKNGGVIGYDLPLDEMKIPPGSGIFILDAHMIHNMKDCKNATLMTVSEIQPANQMPSPAGQTM